MDVIERNPQPMRFHGPGWTLDLTVRDEHGDVIERGARYQLWAPQDGAIADPHGYAEHQSPEWVPRAHWAASWQSDDRDAGDFTKADSADGALSIFEPTVRAKFAAVIARV